MLFSTLATALAFPMAETTVPRMLLRQANFLVQATHRSGKRCSDQRPQRASWRILGQLAQPFTSLSPWMDHGSPSPTAWVAATTPPHGCIPTGQSSSCAVTRCFGQTTSAGLGLQFPLFRTVEDPRGTMRILSCTLTRKAISTCCTMSTR